jgi:4-aminobutyrate aminotransferase
MKHNISTPPPGPRASQVIGLCKKFVYDSTFTYPLVIRTGKGCYIEDIDGNIFLDFSSNIGACPLGYSHPEIIQVLAEYSKNGAHKIAGQDFYSEEHALLASKVSSITPENFKAFFVNSGAEAVENAIKIAYSRMGPLPGVSCTGAFHGRTLGALTFTFSKPVQKANFPEFAVKRIKFCTADGDPDIESIEPLLKENKAAFILSEVVQGEGGYNFASLQFMKNLSKFSKLYGVPLILDEVQSGMGRTGRWWAFEHYNIKPDIMSAAKALQVGAAIYDRDLEPARQGVLSSTWGGGSRIDMAVGAKTIDIIARDRLLENAAKMGSVLKKSLQDIVGKGGLVDVRGLGLMIGVEFDTKQNRDSKLVSLFKKGLLLLPAGQKAMRVIPPLIINDEEAQEGLEIIDEVLRSNQ